MDRVRQENAFLRSGWLGLEEFEAVEDFCELFFRGNGEQDAIKTQIMDKIIVE